MHDDHEIERVENAPKVMIVFKEISDPPFDQNEKVRERIPEAVEGYPGIYVVDGSVDDIRERMGDLLETWDVSLEGRAKTC